MEVIENGQYRARIEYDEGYDLDMMGDRMGKFYTGKKAADHGFPSDVVLYPNSDNTHSFDKSEFVYCAPVYGLSHSGLSISLGSFNDPWDSAMIGFYAVSASEAEAWFGKDYVIGQVEAQAESEVKEMDSAIRGDVYYVVVEKRESCGKANHPEYELVESCGGFIGYKYALAEAESMLSVHAA
jgi:hypothetical protein